MYVCISLRNRFTIEIYRFINSLRTFWHVLLRMPSQLRLRTWKIEDDPRMSPDVWKTVNCSTKG